MTGISDMFAELSQPDEFTVQAQLELFAWREKQARDARWRFKPKLRQYRREHMARCRRDPIKAAVIRERNRKWMANKRAQERQARAA